MSWDYLFAAVLAILVLGSIIMFINELVWNVPS